MGVGKPLIEIEYQQDRIEKQVIKAGGHVPDDFLAMVEKVQGLNMDQLQHDKGLNWEKVQGKKAPRTGLQLYSMRINSKWRALCVLHTGPIIEILAIREHDKAY
jgi:hypothetical protein